MRGHRATAVAIGLVFATLGLATGMVAANPIVHLVCDEVCIAIDPIPATGHVDLVVLGDGAKPRGGSGRAAFRFASCGGERQCVDDVPVDLLRIRGRAFSGRLVGPDVVDAAVPQDVADAEADAFDDAVLVGGPRGYRCSGVALDATHVLTAAHCAPASHVGLGADATTAKRVDVIRSALHPDADAAVLTLAAPIEVRTHPRRGDRDDAPPVGRLRVLGFGVRDPRRFTGFGTRRQVDLSVDGWGCPRLRAAALGCRPGHEMHIHDGAGNDTCFGDSGGPVFEATVTGWRLVAITSRGAQPRKVLCGEGGLYVRVDRLSPWLREATLP